MKTTCGVFIFDKNKKLLIGHPTGFPFNLSNWSIPKGEPDEGELPIDTAIREVFEETGISINKEHLVPIGSQEYKSGKKNLIAYMIQLKVDGSSLNADCKSTFINKEGKVTKEIDVFEWVQFPIALTKLHEAQIPLLTKAIQKLG